MGFASRRRGAGAMRGRAVLGRVAPSEMVSVGLEIQVARPEDTEDRRRSRRLWRVGGWCAAGIGQAWQRVRRAMGWPGRRSSRRQRIGRCRRRMFGAWHNCGEKFNSLGDALGGRGWYVDAVAAVALGGCVNVPAVDAVTGPGATDGRGFMD